MSSPTGWERPEPVEPEIVETEVVEPTEAEPESATEVSQDVVDAVVVDSDPTSDVTSAEPAAADAAEPAPVLAEVVAEPESVPADLTTEPEPALVDDTTAPDTIGPARRLVLDDAEPAPVEPTSFDVAAAAAPATPVTPAAPPGGSWLDLPPLAGPLYDTPPSSAPVESAAPGASGFSPLPGQGPYDAPQQPPTPSYTQPSFGDYNQQAAAESYGHGTPSPQAVPPQSASPYQTSASAPYPPAAPYPGAAGQQAPYAPYGAPAGATPGYGLQPYQYGTDTSTASMAHWLGILVGFLAPLIIMLTRGQQDPNVRANAVESLNFQLTMLVGYIVSFILTFAFIGVIGFMVLPILGLIFPILGAVAANRGEAYRYPVRIPFVK